jgi:hypothetical protein
MMASKVKRQRRRLEQLKRLTVLSGVQEQEAQSLALSLAKKKGGAG